MTAMAPPTLAPAMTEGDIEEDYSNALVLFVMVLDEFVEFDELLPIGVELLPTGEELLMVEPLPMREELLVWVVFRVLLGVLFVVLPVELARVQVVFPTQTVHVVALEH